MSGYRPAQWLERFQYLNDELGMCDFAACLMSAIEKRPEVLVGPRPGKLHDRRAKIESGGEAILTCIEQKKIQSEWLVGFLASCSRTRANLFRRKMMATHCAKPASIRHRGGHRWGRRRSHTSERDGVLNIKQITD